MSTEVQVGSARSWFGTFVWAVLVGMGFHIGWAIIGAIVNFIASSMGR